MYLRRKPKPPKADPELDAVRYKALAASHGPTIKSAQEQGLHVDPLLLKALDEIEKHGEAAVIGGIETEPETEGLPESPEVPVFAPEAEPFTPAAAPIGAEVTLPPPAGMLRLVGKDISRVIGRDAGKVYGKSVAPNLHVVPPSRVA